MATPVIMPRQGQSVESCIITKWNVNVGDKISVGDTIFTYETDKSTFEEKAKVDGEMIAIFFEEGDDVECLLNVCVIGEKGENISEYDPKNAIKQEFSEEKSEIVQENVIEEKIEIKIPATGSQKISPRAKNVAETTGADLRYAVATGPNGRIIERDVRKLISDGKTVSVAAKSAEIDSSIAGSGLAGMVSVSDLTAITTETTEILVSKQDSVDFAAFEEVKLPNIRKVIAKQMHASLSESAQLTLNSSFDATEILRYRNEIKENREKLGLANITLNDIILYAVSRVLLNHKDLNAHFLGDKIAYFTHVNLGIAIDTPRGLMVPTMLGANTLSLNEISLQSKKLQEEAVSGTINPDKLKGGTFTVTNLGGLGIESFTPVINTPQTGILGVDNITTKFKMIDEEAKPYQAMGLSLTFDHRALDGAPAAKFLKDLSAALENFTLLLAK